MTAGEPIFTGVQIAAARLIGLLLLFSSPLSGLTDKLGEAQSPMRRPAITQGMLGLLLRAGLADRLRLANVFGRRHFGCRSHQVQLRSEDLPLIAPAASNQARALRILHCRGTSRSIVGMKYIFASKTSVSPVFGAEIAPRSDATISDP